MVIYSYSVVDFYKYDFSTLILYEIMLNFCQNCLLNMMLHAAEICSVILVNTETELNFLGTVFF